MAAGRGFAANEYHAPVIVLGYRVFKQRFAGDPSIIGKPITVSGHLYTVVGVAPPGFHGLDEILDPQFWVPLGDLPELIANSPKEDSRHTQWVRIAARLKPGATQAQGIQELGVIAERLDQAHPESDKNNGFHIEPTNAPPPRGKKAFELFITALSAVALLVPASRAPTLPIFSSRRERSVNVRWRCDWLSEPHARSFSANSFSKASFLPSREAPSGSFSPYGPPMRSPPSACPSPSR